MFDYNTVEDYVAAAEAYHPEYWIGDLPNGFFRTGFSICRDSDIREQSNYAAAVKFITEASSSAFVDTIHSTHWAVGWTEELLVKMRNNDGSIATAAVECYELIEAHVNGEILWDTDYYDREFEEEISNLGWLTFVPADRELKEKIRTQLIDVEYSYPEHEHCWPEKDVFYATWMLGLMDDDDKYRAEDFGFESEELDAEVKSRAMKEAYTELPL